MSEFGPFCKKPKYLNFLFYNINVPGGKYATNKWSISCGRLAQSGEPSFLIQQSEVDSVKNMFCGKRSLRPWAVAQQEVTTPLCNLRNKNSEMNDSAIYVLDKKASLRVASDDDGFFAFLATPFWVHFFGRHFCKIYTNYHMVHHIVVKMLHFDKHNNIFNEN